MATPQQLKTASRLHLSNGLTTSQIPDFVKESDLGVPSNRRTVDLPPNREQYISQIAEQSKTIEFLQDQVKRLNIELGRYQALYPNANIDEKELKIAALNAGQLLEEDDPIPPWLINARLMSPLLVSYDERISQLNSDISMCKEELENFSGRMKSLVQENEQLRSQLKRTVEEKVRTAEKVELLQSGNFPNTNSERSEYQERLDLLKAENDLLLEQQKNLQDEYEALRQELLVKNSFRTQVEEYSKAQKDLIQQLEAVAKERAILVKENAELEKNLESLQNRVHEFQRSVEQTKSEAANASRELQSMKNQRDDQTQRNSYLEKEIRDLQQRNVSISRQLEETKESFRESLLEVQNVRQDREEMLKTMLALEKRVEEFAKKEINMDKTLSDSLASLEEARLLRDQAVIREEQAIKESRRLEQRLAQQKRDMEKAFDEEKGLIKDYHKKQQHDLTEELKKVEIQSAEYKAQVERVIREKRILESDFERVRKENQVARLNQMLDEIRNKMLAMEADRDTALQKADSASVQEKRIQSQFQKEKQQLSNEVGEFQRKVKRLERELDDIKSEKLKLLAKSEELTKENSMLQGIKSTIEFKYSREINTLTRNYEHQKREWETQARDHIKAIEGLKEVISSNNEMKSKWKEELRKMEKLVTELKEENFALAQKNSELSMNLERAFGEVDSYNIRERSLISKSELEITEQRLQEQTSSFLQREAEILNEQKTLWAKLDQSTIEKNRITRELENTRKQLLEAKEQITKLENVRPGYELELRQSQETIGVLQTQINRLREDKKKLREKLKQLVW